MGARGVGQVARAPTPPIRVGVMRRTKPTAGSSTGGRRVRGRSRRGPAADSGRHRPRRPRRCPARRDSGRGPVRRFPRPRWSAPPSDPSARSAPCATPTCRPRRRVPLEADPRPGRPAGCRVGVERHQMGETAGRHHLPHLIVHRHAHRLSPPPAPGARPPEATEVGTDEGPPLPKASDSRSPPRGPRASPTRRGADNRPRFDAPVQGECDEAGGRGDDRPCPAQRLLELRFGAGPHGDHGVLEDHGLDVIGHLPGIPGPATGWHWWEGDRLCEARWRTVRQGVNGEGRDLVRRGVPVVLRGQVGIRSALAEFGHADEVSVEWRSFELDPPHPPGWRCP